jgi:hypothetical protein
LSRQQHPSLSPDDLIQQLERDAKRYKVLRDWLISEELVQHCRLSVLDTGPCVIFRMFFGNTFEDALDTLMSKEQTKR